MHSGRLALFFGVLLVPRLVSGQCATPSDTVVTSVLACQPYTWTETGDTYSVSTSASALSSDGCTLYILNLTKYDNQVDVRRIFTCDSYYWSETGETYTTSGTYSHKETTDQGCVIDHQLVLTVSNAYNSSEGAADCDSYAWQEMNFPSGGMTGTAVDLDGSGTIMAVGDESAGTSGEVRVYRWSESGWSQMGATLTAEFNPEHFGAAVSLSANGKYLAVGSPYRNPVGGFATYGQVKVFEWSGSGWVQRGGTIAGISEFDELGFSVDLSNDGNVLAAGAPSSGRVAIELGEVRVYQWTGEDWTQMGDNIYKYEFLSSANNNGYSVSLSGDGTKLVFGAPFSKGFIKNVPGKYFIFKWDGSQWSQVLNTQGATDMERFGWAVAISNDGGKSAVSSPAYSTNTGKVASRFQQLTGDAPGAHFGGAIAINDDAGVLAVGSPDYSSTDELVGRVQIFRDNGNGYQQMGEDITGTTPDEFLGSAIALNHNGNMLAVNGHVYYYGCTSTTQNCAASKCAGPVTSVVDKSACNAYVFDGVSYLESGTYHGTFTSHNGCDSLVTLNLTIIPTSFTYDISACDSFVFNGSTLTTSGTYSAWWPPSTTYSGCDSSVVIHLTIGEGHDTYIQNVSACKSYEFNGTTLTESGTYEALFTRPGGCDSIVSLNLTIDPVKVNKTVETCGSYAFDGNTLTESGVYNGSFTAASGCDSLVTLHLTINKSYDRMEDVQACNSFAFDGNTLTSPGTYHGSFTTAAGCDSLVTLNLTIVSGFDLTQSVTACDSYMFGGEALTSSGAYQHLFTTADGCDSLVSLNLTLNTSQEVVLVDTTCVPVDFYGQTLTASGNYQKHFTSVGGCDSLVTINLTYLDSFDDECAGTTTGIEKGEALTKIKLYPNATTGNVSIDLGKRYDNLSLQVSTLSGQVIKTRNYKDTGFIRFSLAAPPGIYIVRLISNGTVFSQKLEKN